MIVIGGGIAAAGDALFVPLRGRDGTSSSGGRTGAQSESSPPTLGEYAGALGAAWNAMNGSGPD